jgi:cob(I)alamin adenosyltransferase
MTQFYTRRGDQGYTGLLGEDRVPKYHPRIEAVGTIDEANAVIGLARTHCSLQDSQTILLNVQRDLYLLMSETAATPERQADFRSIDHQRVEWLEQQIDSLAKHIQMPAEFITPGDTPGGAMLDLARTVVRRAERIITQLYHQHEIDNANLLSYLNRLSSLLFILELTENKVGDAQNLTLVKPE